MSKQIIDKILKICLEEKLQGKELIIALEEQISLLTPFDHNADNSMVGCGLKNIKMGIDTRGSLSEIVEKFEKGLTKREIAFAMVVTTLEEKGILDAVESRNPFATGRVGFKSMQTGGPGSPDIEELLKGIDNIEDFERLMKAMLTSKRGPGDESSECAAEDSSECWKCSKRGSCNKFKN